MATAIIMLSKLEIRTIIRFLSLKNYKSIQIHGKGSGEVYDEKKKNRDMQLKSCAICLKVVERISTMITVMGDRPQQQQLTTLRV
jgi:hypothetical protein